MAAINLTQKKLKPINKNLWCVMATGLWYRGQTSADFVSNDCLSPAFIALAQSLKATAFSNSEGSAANLAETIIGYANTASGSPMGGYNCGNPTAVGGICVPNTPFIYDGENMIVALAKACGVRYDIVANVQYGAMTPSQEWRDQIDWRLVNSATTAPDKDQFMMYGEEQFLKVNDPYWGTDETNILNYNAKIYPDLKTRKANQPALNLVLDSANFNQGGNRYCNEQLGMTHGNHVRTYFNYDTFDFAFTSDFNNNLGQMNFQLAMTFPENMNTFFSYFPRSGCAITQWGNHSNGSIDDIVKHTTLDCLWTLKLYSAFVNWNYSKGNHYQITYANYTSFKEETQMKAVLPLATFTAMQLIGVFMQNAPQYVQIASTIDGVNAISAKDSKGKIRVLLSNETATSYNLPNFGLDAGVISNNVRWTRAGKSLDDQNPIVEDQISETSILIRPFSVNVYEF